MMMADQSKQINGDARSSVSPPLKRQKVSSSSSSSSKHLVRVELAKSGRGHCGWCDCSIEQDTPRCVYHIFHAPGSYNRNNGANKGYNEGGEMPLFLHPTCTWHPKPPTHSKRGTQCQGGCGHNIPPTSWSFQTMLGSGSSKERCTQSRTAPVAMCVACVETFVDKHHAMLCGYVSGHTMLDAEVAWERGRSNPFEKVATMKKRTGPKDKGELRRLRNSFEHASFTKENKAKAKERHVALQRVIATAMEEDKKQGGKSVPQGKMKGKKRG
jgi:hypothetical protein